MERMLQTILLKIKLSLAALLICIITIVFTGCAVVDKLLYLNPFNDSQRSPRLSPQQIHTNNEAAVFAVYVSHDGLHWSFGGSAFFVDAIGTAVTAHHVMVTWPYAHARASNGQRFRITGFYFYDIDNDLAIIQVDGTNFQYVTFGDSTALRAGDYMFTLGSPSGNHNSFYYTSLRRHAQKTTFPGTPPIIYSIVGMLEYSTANTGMAPGLSGGAVLNDRGEVIGVHVAGEHVYSRVGFAVPISRVDLSSAMTRRISTLPIMMPGAVHVFNYPLISFIPTFDSVNINAEFVIGGSIESFFPDDGVMIRLFDYMYGYTLASKHIEDMHTYIAVLLEHGFIRVGDGAITDESIIKFFYHPGHDVTMCLFYRRHDNIMFILLGRGNTHPYAS